VCFNWLEHAGRGVTVVPGLAGRVEDERMRPTEQISLTPAETRVAELVARGYTNPQVAGVLVVSVRTVQAHLIHIYQKLGLHSRVQLAVLVATTRPAAADGLATAERAS
jgi:DNA-binding NarL/FixJ family response regulator